MLPAERRKVILERLARQGRVTVAELSQELGVSPMTVHRDLNVLAAQGRLRKVRGGAVPLPRENEPLCHFCAGKLRARVRMTLHLSDGSTWRACCAHCGLLGVALHGSRVVAAVVPDFLTGRVVDVHQATFLIGSDVEICCTPTVLAFARLHDAERFRQGFGGQVASFAEALEALRTMMALPPAPPTAPAQESQESTSEVEA